MAVLIGRGLDHEAWLGSVLPSFFLLLYSVFRVQKKELGNIQALFCCIAKSTLDRVFISIKVFYVYSYFSLYLLLHMIYLFNISCKGMLFMRIDLLPPTGNDYKANLHCHTKAHDLGKGLTTPLQIKELYKSKGYHIISFTDHNKLTYRENLNDDTFMALPGFEVTWNDPETLKIYHFNCFPKHPGVKEDYFPLDLGLCVENINKLIQFYVDNDYLVMYNHPAASFHGSAFHETEDFCRG